MKKWIFGLVITVLVWPFGPLRAAGYNSAAATTYLLAHAQNPWSTMALSALGAANIPGDYLKSVSGSAALDYEAPILAIASLNQDPHTFASTDLVAKLKAFYSGGQIGDAATLNDDIFGLLALLAAGESASDSTLAGTKGFILSHQQADGGWGFLAQGPSDSNMTSAAMVALVASGISASDSRIQSALNYLKTAQNTDGGFTYDPKSSFGTGSDASSTAWAIWALNSLNISPASVSNSGHTPDGYLSGQQTTEGWFKYQDNSTEDAFSAVTTAYAAIALAGKTLPVKIFTPQNQQGGSADSSPKFAFRIEGASETVCEGQAQGPTALDVVKNAGSLCGFSYHIKNTSFGPYLDKINSDEAGGSTGWLYLVNFISPEVGAADYQLKTGDTLLWYFGEFGWTPARLSLSASSLASGQAAVATVEAFQNQAWGPLGGAKVNAGLISETTALDGKANLALSDGFYKVFAEKSGFIRSNRISVKVGNPSGQDVSVKVKVNAGVVAGTSIGFSLNQNTLDFGTLSPGQSAERKLILTNTGTTNLKLAAEASGDSLIKESLLINSATWPNFKANLAQSAQMDALLGLKIPSDYSGGSGTKNATITFWAVGQ